MVRNARTTDGKTSSAGDQSGESQGFLDLDDISLAQSLFGVGNEHLRIIEQTLSVRIGVRGAALHVQGDAPQVELCLHTIRDLAQVCRGGYPLHAQDVTRAVRLLARDQHASLSEYMLSSLPLDGGRRRIQPRSLAQKQYLDAMRKCELVFGIGPAGTGKTYLAVAMAVSYLMEGKVNRIILTRPAVEAGEKLGFLPGSYEDKVNPYLRPLYDALYDLAPLQRVQQWQANGEIEVAPLAFMRGRTLSRSFIILDEAQNTTPNQMKMFLTRMGENSRMVVTGDDTQIDLPDPRNSGLVQAEKLLAGVPGIEACRFTDVDVVRHYLVQRIILAYDGRREAAVSDVLTPHTSSPFNRIDP